MRKSTRLSTIERLLTIEEVSAILSITPRWARQLIEDGKLAPVHKLGSRSWRIPESSLRSFLQATQVNRGAGQAPAMEVAHAA